MQAFDAQALQGAAAAHRRADAGEVRADARPGHAAQGPGEPGRGERAVRQRLQPPGKHRTHLPATVCEVTHPLCWLPSTCLVLTDAYAYTLRLAFVSQQTATHLL